MKKTIAGKKAFSLVLLPFLMVLGCGNGSESPGQSARMPTGFGTGGGAVFPVKAEAVTRQSISQYIVTNTTLEAERHIDVMSKSSGLVTEVLVEEGDRVSKGEALARLERKEIEIEVQEAKLDLENSTKSFDRTSNLKKQNMIGEDEFEKAEYQMEVSKLRLQKSQLSLANTEIQSPIDGIVTGRSIDVGQTINQNQAVFQVGDFDPLFAYIYVPERDLGKVRSGQAVVIKTESFPDDEYTGIVKRISPVVEAASGTGKITIEVASAGRRMKPGMFVSVYLAVVTHPDALVVPKKAVVLERDQEIVFVVTEGAAVRTIVEQGLSETDFVEILSGVQEGDRIITVGQESVQDGSAVRIVGEEVAVNPAAGSVPGAGGGQPGTAGRDSGQGAAGSDAGGGSGGGRGAAGQEGGPGGFDLSQLPPERLKMIEERLLTNPDVKKEYDKRLKADPDLEKNQEKKIAFLQEMVQQFGMGGRQR